MLQYSNAGHNGKNMFPEYHFLFWLDKLYLLMNTIKESPNCMIYGVHAVFAMWAELAEGYHQRRTKFLCFCQDITMDYVYAHTWC